MAGALEARAIILGEDRTGPAFDSVKARIAGLAKTIAVMDRATGSVGAVAKSVDSISSAVARADAEVGRFTQASRSIDTISTAMGHVDRASAAMSASMARSSSSVAKLSTELTSAEAKLKAIGEFKMSSRALDQAGLSLRKSQQDVRLLSAEMAKVGTPNKQMEASLAAAQAATMRLAEEFKVEGGAAREARAALAELNVPIARLRTEEERLQATIEGTTRALHEQAAAEHSTAAATAENARAAERAARDEQRLAQRQARENHLYAERRAEGMEHHGFRNFALQSAAMAVGAGEVIHLGVEAVDQGAELQRARLGLQNAGRTAAEIQEIEIAARKVIADQPTASMLDAVQTVAETTTAFGSVEHAIKNLPFVLKATSVLKAAGGEHIHGSTGDIGRALAKTFEERQTRPEDFEKEARAMIPAMVVSGGTFNPEELYAFAQQAKSALPSLSVRFLSRIAPSLIGAQGGERAGTALNAWENVISGKANDKKQAEMWMSLGLLDPKKTQMKAGHVVSWQSGAVVDTKLAMTDPLAWQEKYEVPALIKRLAKQGKTIDDREAVKQILDTQYRNQNANMFASETVQAASRARLHKDEDLINKTGDLDDIYQRNLSEFKTAAEAFKTSISDLAAAATSPLLGRAATGISSFAGFVNRAAAYGFEHPNIAAGTGIVAGGVALGLAGRLAYMLNTGFGLGRSATALDASAAALEGAAASLRAGGMAHSGVPGEAPGATSPGYASLTGRGIFMGLNLAALGYGMDDQLKKDETDGAPVDPAVAREAAMGDAVRAWFRGRTPDLNRPEHLVPLGSAVTDFRAGDFHRGDEMPAALTRSVIGPVPVAIVNAPTPHDFVDHWADGGRAGIEKLSEMHADAFRRDPEAARGHAMLQIETGQVETGAQKVAELQHGLDALSGKIEIDMRSLDAAISKVRQLNGLTALTGTTGSTGPSRVVADPGVGRSR